MRNCVNCGYMWADCDDEGKPISFEYCHYDGLDAYAPCEQDDYIDEDDYEQWKYEMENEWAETQRELDAEWSEGYY